MTNLDLKPIVALIKVLKLSDFLRKNGAMTQSKSRILTEPYFFNVVSVVKALVLGQTLAAASLLSVFLPPQWGEGPSTSFIFCFLWVYFVPRIREEESHFFFGSLLQSFFGLSDPQAQTNLELVDLSRLSLHWRQCHSLVPVLTSSLKRPACSALRFLPTTGSTVKMQAWAPTQRQRIGFSAFLISRWLVGNSNSWHPQPSS